MKENKNKISRLWNVTKAVASIRKSNTLPILDDKLGLVNNFTDHFY